MKDYGLTPEEYLTLEPYERDHCVVVGSYRPVKKWFFSLLKVQFAYL